MAEQVLREQAAEPDPPAVIGGGGLVSRGILAVTIGNMLEFYDFITYSFFAIQIGRTFFPTDSRFASLMLSLATFGAGFITRPIGGLVIGSYSDRVGRRPAMILSFVMMGTAIIVLALTPSYEAIGIAAPIIAIVARMVQGFSLGGEVGPTTAYLMEAAAPGRRGLAVSWQPVSQQIAATTGALVGFVLSAADEQHGARNPTAGASPFCSARSACRSVCGCAPACRRRYICAKPIRPGRRPAASRSVSYAPTRGLSFSALLVLASGTIITYVTQYMTTYAKNTLHVGTDLAFATTVVSNGLGIVGALCGGLLADRIGRWPVMVWPQLVALLLTYPVFLWIVETRSAWALLGGFGVVSLIGSIPYTAFYVAFTEGLPKNIRGGTLATIYAVAIASFGGTAQLVVTWLIHMTGNALAPAWYMLFAGTVGLVAMMMMRETAPGKR